MLQILENWLLNVCQIELVVCWWNHGCERQSKLTIVFIYLWLWVVITNDDHVPETTSDGFWNSKIIVGLSLPDNLLDFLLNSSSITVRSDFSLSLMSWSKTILSEIYLANTCYWRKVHMYHFTKSFRCQTCKLAIVLKQKTNEKQKTKEKQKTN